MEEERPTSPFLEETGRKELLLADCLPGRTLWGHFSVTTQSLQKGQDMCPCDTSSGLGTCALKRWARGRRRQEGSNPGSDWGTLLWVLQAGPPLHVSPSEARRALQGQARGQGGAQASSCLILVYNWLVFYADTSLLPKPQSSCLYLECSVSVSRCSLSLILDPKPLRQEGQGPARPGPHTAPHAACDSFPPSLGAGRFFTHFILREKKFNLQRPKAISV